MARLGLKELRNAFNPSRESVADTELGLYGTATQGEIAQARDGNGDGPEQESPSSTLSLHDLRDSARERSGADERSREQARERDRNGPEIE
jgi:hypothetical protein